MTGFPTVTQTETDQRKVNAVLRNAVDGKLNCTGTVTLTANQATTAVTDYRAGASSTIIFMPQTANAAAALATMYVATQGKQTFTITHANNAQTDRDFRYLLIG